MAEISHHVFFSLFGTLFLFGIVLLVVWNTYHWLLYGGQRKWGIKYVRGWARQDLDDRLADAEQAVLFFDRDFKKLANVSVVPVGLGSYCVNLEVVEPTSSDLSGAIDTDGLMTRTQVLDQFHALAEALAEQVPGLRINFLPPQAVNENHAL
jgi:hypothetical protein